MHEPLDDIPILAFISVYLPEALHRRLKAEASERGIILAALIRELLTLGLARGEEAA